MYRYKDLVSQVSIINNLLNEYEFNPSKDSDSVEEDDMVTSPITISKVAVEGIEQFFKYEAAFKNSQGLVSEKDIAEVAPSNEFDWLTLAIKPNLEKIKEPSNAQIDPTEHNSVVTIARIVGIVDDTTNIKLTLQAITRGLKIAPKKKTRPNEQLLEVDWSSDIPELRRHFKSLKDSSLDLFKVIDKFIVDYRQALSINSANGNKSNLQITKPGSRYKGANGSSQKPGDLLTLNPLANALYLQLAGSKDFSKACLLYTSRCV